jgi:hypothetical protein
MTVGQWWYMTWMTYVYHRVGKWRQGKIKVLLYTIYFKYTEHTVYNYSRVFFYAAIHSSQYDLSCALYG